MLSNEDDSGPSLGKDVSVKHVTKGRGRAVEGCKLYPVKIYHRMPLLCTQAICFHINTEHFDDEPA